MAFRLTSGRTRLERANNREHVHITNARPQGETVIFLEIAGLLVLLTIFAVGAWHVFKYLGKKDEPK